MGQVTIQGGEIVVTGAAVIIGTQYSGFAASISDVVWSLGSDEYATINETTGALAIKPGAFGHEVVVRATKVDNPYQSGELTVKVYYSSQDTATFSEVTVIDVTTNLRDGSPGNPANTMRVCPTNTIAVDGHTNMYIVTTRANKTGYQYYANVQLSTLASGTTTNGNFSNGSPSYICEMGRYGNTQDAPAAKLLPLTETTDFEYGYTRRVASGSAPVSFAYNLQESTDSYYNNCSAIRTTDFANESIKIHLFK